MLSISISLNALSSHGTCTAVFVAVAAITGFLFSSIRTLGKISSLAWIGLVCLCAPWDAQSTEICTQEHSLTAKRCVGAVELFFKR